MFVDEHRDRFGVEPICRTLEISASAYYERRTGRCSARAVEDERLLARIREMREANYSAYGYRRTWIALRLRDRRLQPSGRRLAARLPQRTDLVLDALRMALGQREPGADVELVAHTDRGSQYTSADYTQELTDHGVFASVGTVGDAYDNAMAESFVGTFKTELLADQAWRTRSQLELAAVEYVSWFNHERLPITRGVRVSLRWDGGSGSPPLDERRNHLKQSPWNPVWLKRIRKPRLGPRLDGGICLRAAHRNRES
jgi:hypothetical protein